MECPDVSNTKKRISEYKICKQLDILYQDLEDLQADAERITASLEANRTAASLEQSHNKFSNTLKHLFHRKTIDVYGIMIQSDKEKLSTIQSRINDTVQAIENYKAELAELHQPEL